MRSSRLVVLLSFACVGLFLNARVSHSEARISGTYGIQGSSYAMMLQLTQTENGAVDTVELGADGKLSPQEGSVTGAFDSGQVTLTFNFGLLSSRTLAGQADGDVIQLQGIEGQGKVVSWVFKRGTPAQFQAYAAMLNNRAQATNASDKMATVTKAANHIVADTENWIAVADQHEQRIALAKSAYQHISQRMGELLEQEKTTPNSVTRSQISVAVIQGSVAGTNVDVQVNQVWNPLMAEGQALSERYGQMPNSCGTQTELQATGASQEAIQGWRDACAKLLAERPKFNDAYQNASGQWADLKAFQETEQRKRRAIVDEASKAI